MTGFSNPASASDVRSGPSSRSGTCSSVTENGDNVAKRSHVITRCQEVCYGTPCRRARPSFPHRTNDVRSNCMYATIRRYEGVDKARTDEMTKKAGESLLPRLSETEGFRGYYLIEAGDGVMSSVSFFKTQEQADESTRLASTWVH